MSEYWMKRVSKRMAVYDRKSDKVSELAQRAYDRAAQQTGSEVQHIIGTYSRLHGMTRPEALQYLQASLSVQERDALLDRLRATGQTIADTQERKDILKRLDAAAYGARIKRAEAIKLSAHTSFTKAADSFNANMYSHLGGVAVEAFGRTMYDIQGATYGFGFTGLSTPRIEATLKENWSGTNYKTRVWRNRNKVADSVSQAVLEVLTTGRATDFTQLDIKEQCQRGIRQGKDEALYDMNRILRTETAFVANEAQAEAYKEAGVDEYRILAVLDSRTSQRCQELDGKKARLSDKQVGVNYPPLHPFCRSTTEPVLEGVTVGQTRIARGPDRKTYKVPRDMTYPEWKKWQENGTYPDIHQWLDSYRNGTTLTGPNMPTTLKAPSARDVAKKHSLGTYVSTPGPHVAVNGKPMLFRKSEAPVQTGAPILPINDILHQQGFDGNPMVVDQKEYDKLIEQGRPFMQRTYSAPSVETLEAYAGQLRSGEWYVDCSVGGAQYGQGMYAAAAWDPKDPAAVAGVRKEMQHYAEVGKGRGNLYVGVETMTLHPSARVVKFADIDSLYVDHSRTMVQALGDNIPYKKSLLGYVEDMDAWQTAKKSGAAYATLNKIRERAENKTIRFYDKLSNNPDLVKYSKEYLGYFDSLDVMMVDPGVKAASMGFDAINAEGHGESGSYTVVLNRTKLVLVNKLDRR